MQVNNTILNVFENNVYYIGNKHNEQKMVLTYELQFQMM